MHGTRHKRAKRPKARDGSDARDKRPEPPPRRPPPHVPLTCSSIAFLPHRQTQPTQTQPTQTQPAHRLRSRPRWRESQREPSPLTTFTSPPTHSRPPHTRAHDTPSSSQSAHRLPYRPPPSTHTSTPKPTRGVDVVRVLVLAAASDARTRVPKLKQRILESLITI